MILTPATPRRLLFLCTLFLISRVNSEQSARKRGEYNKKSEKCVHGLLLLLYSYQVILRMYTINWVVLGVHNNKMARSIWLYPQNENTPNSTIIIQRLCTYIYCILVPQTQLCAALSTHPRLGRLHLVGGSDIYCRSTPSHSTSVKNETHQSRVHRC